MTLFQDLALAVLGVLLVGEVLTLRRGSRGFKLLRCVVWLCATVAIAVPDVVTRVGSVLGIGRGADLMLYLFILIFLGTSFYFYSRYIRLQQQLTSVIRHVALQEARRGAAPSSESQA
jgi:hypothetical protein